MGKKNQAQVHLKYVKIHYIDKYVKIKNFRYQNKLFRSLGTI